MAPISRADKAYDHTIAVMKSAVVKARPECEEELAAIWRLDAQARRLEAIASGPFVEAIIPGERTRSHEFGGGSIFRWEPHAESALSSDQRAG